MRTLALWAMLAAGLCHGQDGWRLVRPDMVCMPLEELHLIHAKRSVADELLRERAWVLLEQRKAIDNLRRQLALCDDTVADMGTLLNACNADRSLWQDANIRLQRRADRLRGWATVGKVGVAVVGVAVVGWGVGQVMP